MPVVAGVAFNATTSDKILSKPFPSKSALSPDVTRDRAKLQSQSYPLSINTRIARTITHPKCAFFERLRAQKNNTPKPPDQQVSLRLSEQQNQLCRWLVPLRDTNHHHQCFFLVPSSITKSEPTPEARDPTIFCLTSQKTANADRFQSGCVRRWRGVGAQP